MGLFSISEGDMFEGDLPMKIQQLVREFIDYYKEQLIEMWKTQKFEMLPPIAK